MRILSMRHTAIRVELSFWDATVSYYRGLGYVTASDGDDRIEGKTVKWMKLSDGYATIELVCNHEPHLAFEVDEIDEGEYYYISPSGHRIQFDRDPSGNLVEYVQIIKGVIKGVINVKELRQDGKDAEDNSGDRNKS